MPFKIDGEYLEIIPQSRKANYWRDGVRVVSNAVYNAICQLAKLEGYAPKLPDPNDDFESYDGTEGTQRKRYSSYYERNPLYRIRAIEIHGLACMACSVDFAHAYGAWGSGFIHVHHNKPISETGPTRINPLTDMSVVCPNCHAMIHRKRASTLSVEEVKKLIQEATIP